MKINARRPLTQTSILAPINPWFITGFTDGEGSWGLSISKDSSRKVGFSVIPKFTIGLHAKDIDLLERIADQLGVGRISIGGSSIRRILIKKGTLLKF